VEKEWSSLESGERVPLLKTAFSMTIKGITRCIFDDSFEDQLLVEKVSTAYMSAWGEMEARIKEGSSPPEGSERDVDFEKNRGYLRDVVKGVIDRRREGLGGEHVPFIDNLLQSGVPDDQVVSDAIAFMIGGFHTSGNFIVWMMWYLATHPEVQEQLREELERETGGERGDRLRKYASAVSTNYTTYFRQVQDETLRLSTLAPWAVRESPDDIIIDGHLVPGGTPIIQALGVGLHNATTWKEGELEEFNPDRFAVHTDHARRGLEFCPFGTPSRRKCPGYTFSHFETTVILAILLFRFQLVAVPDQVVERDHGLVTMPAKELFVLVKER
jgi:cytochrome P450 family 20 subfamily A